MCVWHLSQETPMNMPRSHLRSQLRLVLGCGLFEQGTLLFEICKERMLRVCVLQVAAPIVSKLQKQAGERWETKYVRYQFRWTLSRECVQTSMLAIASAQPASVFRACSNAACASSVRPRCNSDTACATSVRTEEEEGACANSSKT